MIKRSFTGDVGQLMLGQKFRVITSAGNRPHKNTAELESFVVVRREDGRVIAEPAIIRLDEDAPLFTTYTSRDDAPLSASR